MSAKQRNRETPRRLKKGPRRLRVWSRVQADAVLRVRAALKVAQRERAGLTRAFARVEVAPGVDRPVLLSGRQLATIVAVQKSIGDAQRALLDLQRSAYDFRGRFVDTELPPITVADLGVDPWKLFIRYEQLVAENKRLRRLIAVCRRLGHDFPGD